MEHQCCHCLCQLLLLPLRVHTPSRPCLRSRSHPLFQVSQVGHDMSHLSASTEKHCRKQKGCMQGSAMPCLSSMQCNDCINYSVGLNLSQSFTHQWQHFWQCQLLNNLEFNSEVCTGWPAVLPHPIWQLPTSRMVCPEYSASKAHNKTTYCT